MNAARACFAVVIPLALFAGGLHGEEVELFLDTYDVSANSSDVNHEIGIRQSGAFFPIGYTDGGEPIFSQVGNGDVPSALLLAGRSGGTSGRISLNHDFVKDPGMGMASVIEFDVNPVLTGSPVYNVTQTSWITVNFGTTASTRNEFPQFNDGIGLLFRGNGFSQAFDNRSWVGDNRFASQADDLFHHIRIEIFDPADGNPFDGNGSDVTVRAFSDGSTDPFFTHVRPGGFSSNYISLMGYGEGGGGDGVVRHALDNLRVSISEPVPEPSTLALLAVGAVGLVVCAWRKRRTAGRARTGPSTFALLFALGFLCSSSYAAEGDLYAVASGSHLGELYRVDPTDVSSTLVGNTGIGFQALAYSPRLAALIGVDDSTKAVLAINPSDATTGPVLDWQGNPVHVSAGTVFGLAYNPAEHNLYGVDSDWMTFKTSLVTGTTETIGPVGFTPVRGLGIDPDTGTIYGYYEPTGNDYLITIDPESGAGTVVGDTKINDGDGLTFDPVRGVLYTRDRYSDVLFRIDPATAEATAVDSMRGYGVYGMAVQYVPEPSTFVLLGMGVVGLLVWTRRKRRGRTA